MGLFPLQAKRRAKAHAQIGLLLSQRLPRISYPNSLHFFDITVITVSLALHETLHGF